MAKAETLDDLLQLRVTGSIAEFCGRAGLTPRALHALRTGAVENPRMATVGKLASALRVSPARVRRAIARSGR